MPKMDIPSNKEQLMNHPDTQSKLLEVFLQDGFVCVPQFLDQEAQRELLENVQRFIHEVVPVIPHDQVFYEDKRNPLTLKQIQHLEAHDTWFRDLFIDSPFTAIAETMLGTKCIPMNLQYFNKPPRTSQPTPPHQDGFYFMIAPCNAVTMWLALDEVDEKNGCVRYVRGSHHEGLHPHTQTTTLGFSQEIEHYDDLPAIDRETPTKALPGDLLIHHAMTIHRADANESPDRQRRALGFIYYSADAKPDHVTHAAYQQRLKREWKQADRI